MSALPHAESFRDLVVYQKAKALAKRIFVATRSFPRDETYSLIDQVRRSSRSIGAQITEAWAKRRYENHFISKLTDADAEQQETQHWIDTAEDCEYLSKEHTSSIIAELAEIGRLLQGMINKSDLFCGSGYILRESAAEYYAPPSRD